MSYCKLRASVHLQKMEDLLVDRLAPSLPLLYCAVDYFGPWLTKKGLEEVKRYELLLLYGFTCYTFRVSKDPRKRLIY